MQSDGFKKCAPLLNDMCRVRCSLFNQCVSSQCDGTFDSSVSWRNLTPIGRNTSGAIAFNDFAEIDTALNTTQYFDSVNNTYTSSGSIKASTSYNIFKITKNNIPIVNSTNSSNFITGILWDTSDDLNGEYNGSEDIVFATKIEEGCSFNAFMRNMFGRRYANSLSI